MTDPLFSKIGHEFAQCMIFVRSAKDQSTDDADDVLYSARILNVASE